MSRRVLCLAILGCAAMLAGGCGTRAVVERSADDFERSTTQSTTFVRESEMEKASRLVGERDFAGAIEIYRRLYRSSPDQDERAEGLLGWARAEGDLLNPERDVPQAIARLELLLSEFPDAEVRTTAEEELRRLRARREGSAGS